MRKKIVKGEEGLEKKVEALDFHEIGKKVSHPKIGQKVEDVSKNFDYLITHVQDKIYEEDAEKKKKHNLPKGVKVHKVTPINDQEIAEGIADELGLYFADNHNLGERIRDLKNKLKKGKLKEGETKEDLETQLSHARNELSNLGFNWEEVKSYLGERGLDNSLRDSLKESYSSKGLAYESSKYLNRVTGDHKDLLIDHLKKVNPNLVKYLLKKKELPDLLNVFVQTHGLMRAHTKSDEKSVLDKKLSDTHGHLYRKKSEVKSPYK